MNDSLLAVRNINYKYIVVERIISVCWLKRKYYENDKGGFYYRKMNLSCPEQMIYQSFRNYNLELDFDLFFLEDINIKMFKKDDSYIIKPNSLNSYTSWYREIIVTEDYKNALEAIDCLLAKGKLVIFQAPVDKLKTYSWYNPQGDATMLKHNAIILGQDSKYYFYLDSPPTRNKKNFQAHPDNSAVGLILKEELLEAFKIKCRIAYIEINSNSAKKLYGINDICCKIIKNYHKISCGDEYVVGAQAIDVLIMVLEENKKSNFGDVFISNLICSHLKRLYYCGLKTNYFDENDEICQIINEGIKKWEVIENLVIKWNMTNNSLNHITKNLREYQIICKKMIQALEDKVGYLEIR